MFNMTIANVFAESANQTTPLPSFTTAVIAAGTPSNSLRVILQKFLLVMGSTGLIANCVVLVALAVFGGLRRNSTNVLAANIMAIDIVACVALVATMAIQLKGILFRGLGGPTGNILCVLFYYTSFLGSTTFATQARLIVILVTASNHNDPMYPICPMYIVGMRSRDLVR